jgi:hypothetical protein
MSRADDLSLARDERGAMIVMGLFFAVMLSGFLYYLIGVGEAIVYRETMQDAADAGAFSAAVVHARGMNILVLINLIMAALLAVLVALKLIQTLIIAAIVVCGALAFVTFGATLAAIPPLQSAQSAVGRVHDSLKPVVFNLLRVGHETAGVVRVAIPPAATVRAYDVVMDDAFAPAPRFGFTWPIGIGRTLPTEDGEYEVLCHRAGAAVGDIVALPFRAIHRRVADWISGRVAGLARSFSQWFCSGGQGSPDFSFDIDVAIPETTSPAIEACEREDRTQADCDQAERDQQASHPPEDATPYDCPRRPDGTDEPLCAQRTSQARVVCAPTAGRRFDYVYQEARMRRWFWREQVGRSDPPEYRNRHTGDALSDPDDASEQDELRSARRRTSEINPCFGFVPGGGGGGWSTRDLEDLCGRDAPSWPAGYLPPTQLPIGRENAVAEEWTMIRRLFACHESRSESAPIDGDSGQPSDTRNMTPQRMRARDADGEPIELGEEHFQVRMIVLGNAPGDHMERGVELANRGRDVGDEDAAISFIRELGEYSVAQAEFFYPSTDLEDREEWLWNMRWRARMRRFVVPFGDDGSSSCRGMAGSGASGTCGETAGIVGFLRNAVVH